MTRREWIRLLILMIAITGLALFIVFVSGNHAGTPTQRNPSPAAINP